MPLLPASTIFTEDEATTPIMIRTIIAPRTNLIAFWFTFTPGD
jgi:hypothetical protein